MDEKKTFSLDSGIAEITSAGEVTLTFFFFYNGWCYIESEFFPFDWHTCFVIINSKSIGLNIIHPFAGIDLSDDISSASPLWWVK